MKKTLMGPILTLIVLILVGALFIYFYISLNRLESRVMETQTMIAENSGTIQGLINFINSAAQPLQ